MECIPKETFENFFQKAKNLTKGSILLYLFLLTQDKNEIVIYPKEAAKIGMSFRTFTCALKRLAKEKLISYRCVGKVYHVSLLTL